MKRIASLLAMATLATSLMAGGAQATTVTYGSTSYGSTPNTQLRYNENYSGALYNVLVSDFDSSTWTPTSFTGTYVIPTGSVSGQYAAPSYGAGQDATKYLAVYGDSSITYKFDKTYDYFGLWWGSIDTYNTLTFYNGSDQVGSYRGNDLVGLTPNGDQRVVASNRFINFTDLTFDSVKLSSGSNSFEVDNLTVGNTTAPVPEPGTMVLLGAGMLGLAIFGKRRMNKE